MIARLLYAAVALCLLGTWPERAATHALPSAAAAGAARVVAAGTAPAAVRATPADFAIPPIRR